MKSFPSQPPPTGLRTGRTSSALPGPRSNGAGRISAAGRGAGAVLRPLALVAALVAAGCTKKFERMTEPVEEFVSEAAAGTPAPRLRHCFIETADEHVIAAHVARIREIIHREGVDAAPEVVYATAARATIRAWSRFLFTVEYGSQGWRIVQIQEEMP